jgi:hypothetical protein
MTEEEIKQLVANSLKEGLGSLKDDILGAVDQKNSGLAASIKKQVEKAIATATPPKDGLGNDGGDRGGDDDGGGDSSGDGGGKLTLKALQAQLKRLQDERVAEQEAAKRNSAATALSQAVAAAGSNAPGALSKVLSFDVLPHLTREGDRWFVTKEGQEPVEVGQAIKDYLASPEGQHFVPASGTRGAGSAETRTTAPAGGAAVDKLTDAGLLEAFAEI